MKTPKLKYNSKRRNDALSEKLKEPKHNKNVKKKNSYTDLMF